MRHATVMIPPALTRLEPLVNHQLCSVAAGLARLVIDRDALRRHGDSLAAWIVAFSDEYGWGYEPPEDGQIRQIAGRIQWTPAPSADDLACISTIRDALGENVETCALRISITQDGGAVRIASRRRYERLDYLIAARGELLVQEEDDMSDAIVLAMTEARIYRRFGPAAAFEWAELVNAGPNTDPDPSALEWALLDTSRTGRQDDG